MSSSVDLQDDGRDCGCMSTAGVDGPGPFNQEPITLDLASHSLEPEIVFHEEEDEIAVSHADLEAQTPLWRRVPDTFDPWLSDTQPTTMPAVCLSLLVVVPRIAFCLACAAVALPISILFMALATPMPDRIVQVPAVRWLLVLPIRVCCRLGLLAAGFYWIHTDGQPIARAPIVVSNHTSVADVLYIVWALAPAFVAKTEARRIPYIGQAARALGCIFVERKDRESRAKARAAIEARASGKHAGPPLVVFPEGTCTNGLALIAFERGAFLPGAAVSPLAIAVPKGQCKPDELFSIETVTAMLKVSNTMHVTFLPRYAPNEEEQLHADVFAEGVRVAIARCLDVPLSSMTFRHGLHRHRRERMVAAPAAIELMADAPGPQPWR